MFIMSKRNVILPSVDGTKKHKVSRGFVGDIPDWATKTAYFRALVADGKISVPASHQDKDTQDAADSKVKTRRGKTVTEE